MKRSNRRRSLTAIMVFGLIVSIAYPGAVRSHGLTANGAAQDPDIHVIKDAGLQFELPNDWKAETADNGNILVSFERPSASVTFVIDDKYNQVVAGMKAGLKQKLADMKTDGEPKTDTHNGMSHIAESGTGTIEGVKFTWSIDVLKAAKTVTLLTFGVESVVQAHIDEYEKFVDSIKKI